MPTFLTTSKMSPALAARVEASVQGRRGMQAAASRSPLWVSLARFGLAGVVVFVVWSVVSVRRQERRELEGARSALLESVRAKAAPLTERDRESVHRDESWLMRLAGPYEGDFVAPGLRDPASFASTVARPAVYVRGPLASFGSAGGIAEAASSSAKDPLLVCLLDPPATRTEKTLLAKVRAAYGTSSAGAQATNVSRLGAAELGLPFLAPAWADRVRAALAPEDIEKLAGELAKAPIDEARRAAKAEILVAAMDEPGDGTGPTELDGERAHFVRLALVDVAAEKVILRARKHVDPSWISEAKRPQYAAGLDGCGLAMDLREAAFGAPTKDPTRR